jgi:hypothetical protein
VQDGQRAQGSDTLTAHLLAVASVAAELDPAFAIPPAQRAQMESGLIAFVEGRLQRKFWSPRQDLQSASWPPSPRWRAAARPRRACWAASTSPLCSGPHTR